MHSAPTTPPATRPRDDTTAPSHPDVERGPFVARAWASARQYPIPFLTVTLLLVAGILALAGRSDFSQWPLIVAIVVGGVPLLWNMLKQLAHREFGVDVIAVLAIAGSLALGEYLAGAIIVLMMSGGVALEAYALRRAQSSLSALAERVPREAHVRRGSTLETIPADKVEVGMEVVVRPGEIVPVDGVVVRGAASVSEADLTGEPLPVRKDAGTQVLSGSVDQDGVLDVRATRRSAESQYAQIVRLVESAQQQRAPIHRLADRYAVWFTGLALLIAGGAWALSGDPVYALAVLVVATPCPLILATPIAIMSGIDRGARLGIILKSGAAMEQLGEVDTVVFDKTGTLTLGTPELVELTLPEANGEARGTSDDYLGLAASVEQYSPHILARAVVAAAKSRGLELLPVGEFQEMAGNGASATVAAPSGGVEQGVWRTVAIGNRTFMRFLEVALPQDLADERERRAADGQISSFLAVDGHVVGLLVFADVPRPQVTQLGPSLRANGIREVLLLTGDGQAAAERVGELAQADQVVAQCLPDEKMRIVAGVQEQGRRVLMVGDGVNDAPALALATVGMAIGSQGLTAGASVADAVLLSPDILRVPTAVRLGRRVLRVAKEGIWVGMGLSMVAMVAAALGFLPPAAGAILQEGIDVLVILNALRAGKLAPSPGRDAAVMPS